MLPICTSGIFIRDKKILLGLRSYSGLEYIDGDFRTTPGGRCDEGEEVEATLRREIEEEVGFKTFEIKEKLGVVPGAKKGDMVHVFICDTAEEPILMEPEKFKEWKWFNISAIPDNFINPHILKIIQTLCGSSRYFD
ncbi:MAG: Hydrolase, NUDIX family [Parcubacteria group bacterium GW2011_GWC1_39_29]|uniref:Hydrolase, NUDIX family n=1 Tax=Candidatus Yanofskybacteria bacterium GW2011_GWD1_39_16 TaxID=1619030 RepID=A0A837HTW7_9BACT|nr:MAG: Hydrolase, NUDIX family [Candidatus Yanofskybacteria bacterium GW2011_GWD1_39_16]KKR14441.1 MAG: Hydrolase, NUDIX family [Parcubacteria group bacterium GW2011_GWC1_39_29]